MTASTPPRASGETTRWWQGLRRPRPRISLALQGGGAHGAFTWGVLDALLADRRIHFDGLSGSSAGAMNAVALANGWMEGGREGARRGLADFWTAVGKQMPPGLVTQGDADDIGPSLQGRWLASWAAFFSPSQLNPLGLHPLRELIAGQIDFDRLRAGCPFKLFVGATQANTGKLRIFRERELTLDMLLASACLPRIHHPVEIDGEPYWDGGYAANPAVFPLFYDCDSPDVLLVLLSPLRRDQTPRTVQEIDDRVVELGFSAHFMREMQMYSRATDYSSPGFLTMGRLERRLRKLRFHMIDSSQVANLQRTDTKGLAHPALLERLREQGETCASAWISQHVEGMGRRSTIDVKALFG